MASWLGVAFLGLGLFLFCLFFCIGFWYLVCLLLVRFVCLVIWFGLIVVTLVDVWGLIDFG